MAKLFLLDGMALAYRAHFALIRAPIFNSKRMNTSAVFGFTNTLLDIMGKWEPTHLAVVFDTSAPTERHKQFEAYKATRQEMPEDLSAALPWLDKVIEGFNIPVLRMDGFEADDIIGTIAKRAELEGFDVFMATPDKDFGQLVSEKIKIFKPGRMGSETEILGVPEIKERWGINDITQVIDILALMGDTVDNIPGVPGIGEKTAAKLIAQFGTVENLLASTGQLKGKQKETIEANADAARMSKRLATIDLNVPIEISWDKLTLRAPDEAKLKPIFLELEFNALGRRVFGAEFKANRPTLEANLTQGDLFSETKPATNYDSRSALYKLSQDAAAVTDWLVNLDPATNQIGLALGEEGVALCCKPRESIWIPAQFYPLIRFLIESKSIAKIGAGSKTDFKHFLRLGFAPTGTWLDVEIAHALIDPEARNRISYLAERYLNHSPLPGESPAQNRAMEQADLALELWPILKQKLDDCGQTRVFEEIECPLTPPLARMEHAGIAIDTQALLEYSDLLGNDIENLEEQVYELAGERFNLGSPKQLGVILFEKLKLGEKPKKTKTGQFSTNEQVLESLAAKHELPRLLLQHREYSKLKSTYVDALPLSKNPKTGRIHTTYFQVSTTTGRLASMDPNLQNIPIRTERGREIRKAFIPGLPGYSLLAMDYSQIELRVMAELSGDPGLCEAFFQGMDIHTATAAKVYGIEPSAVDSNMRRTAKMVNFGIIYGISAFGLAQRLTIPRSEAAAIIEQYFLQYPGVKQYMNDTIQFARQGGFVETMTGRRRFVRDVMSGNATIRQAAERNAINMPIQGTAADMIKIAMVKIDRALLEGKYKTRMLLQVHDELLFELCNDEQAEVVPLIKKEMQEALPMKTPIVVESGIGNNWLEAH